MSDKQRDVEVKLDIQKLWEKYEDIAMHFNDLLMGGYALKALLA